MKRFSMILGTFCWCAMICAQQNDPVLMKINGKDVSRSEFEYNYNKNNGDEVVDKKSVDEYVDLFVNYKLKVEAALDARYDTLSSFKKEFLNYRNQLIRPYFISPESEENEVRKYYNQMSANIGESGLILPAHILIMVSQKATSEEQQKAKMRIDSIYAAIKGGASFEELAKACSDDKMTARRGGVVNWLAKGQTIKEFDERAFSLQKGEMSEPFLSPMGYHIILMKDRKQLEPYDQLKDQIKKFLEQRGLKDKIVAMPYNMFFWTMVNLGRVDIWGMDATLDGTFLLAPRHRLVSTLSYTYQKAVDKTDPSSAYYEDQIPYTPEHSGAFSLAWENPYVNVSFHATGVDKRYASVQNIKTNELDGYIEYGVALYRSFKWKRVDCSLRLDVQNLGNKQYSIVKNYPMPGRSYKVTLGINI